MKKRRINREKEWKRKENKINSSLYEVWFLGNKLILMFDQLNIEMNDNTSTKFNKNFLFLLHT